MVKNTSVTPLWVYEPDCDTAGIPLRHGHECLMTTHIDGKCLICGKDMDAGWKPIDPGPTAWDCEIDDDIKESE